MAIEIQLAYVCQRTFDELPGESASKRYCDQCHLEVTNLAALSEREQLELFEAAAASGERICVSTPVPNRLAQPCPGISSATPPVFVPLAGIPVMPTSEQLAQERERLDQEN